jgi:hypothetical protein
MAFAFKLPNYHWEREDRLLKTLAFLSIESSQQTSKAIKRRHLDGTPKCIAKDSHLSVTSLEGGAKDANILHLGGAQVFHKSWPVVLIMELTNSLM